MARIALPERLIAWLFGSTLFISSFLMFFLEPMVGRLFLPRLGGTPVVWNTCLVFFQIALLAGYAVAHGGYRLLGSARHAVAFIVLVVLAGSTLPFTIDPIHSADANPSFWLLGALTRSIGLPFLVLATTTAAMQKWFAETAHPAARDPYFLYAASNAGSLMALLAYPSLLEPYLTLSVQRTVWTAGYAIFGAFALLVTAIIWLNRDGAPASGDPQSGTDETLITPFQRFVWTVWSFIPSSLLLGVTTFLSTDVAPVPLLWILPLTLYLATFVVAFGSRTAGIGRRAEGWIPGLVTAYVLVTASGFRPPFLVSFVMHLGIFVVIALACHGRLVETRPPSQRLTEFYFFLSFGGMLGGVFNALLAPAIFNGPFEYPLVLIAASAIPLLAAGKRSIDFSLWDFLVPIAVSVAAAAAILSFDRIGMRAAWATPVLILLVVAVFSQRGRPVRFTTSLAALMTASLVSRAALDPAIFANRTFFGTYRVTTNERGTARRLLHGTTVHGSQPLAPERSLEPLTYYSRSGPIGQALQNLTTPSRDADIAVVGLGVGSLASYARPGERWTFYEIDPGVEEIARNPTLFTYLEQCGSQCRVVIGDARLSLQNTNEKYSVLILDAFSSDAVPVHLLTREAAQLYLSRVAPSGVLAFHVSNRHLDLGPIVATIAQSEGLVALEQSHSPTREERASEITPSIWMLLARTRSDLEGVINDPRWSPAVAQPKTPLWTDDFSNILSVLRIRN